MNICCHMRDLPGGLQLSGNADVLATDCGSSQVRFIYGPRTVANHEQGRENWFHKEQLTDRDKIVLSPDFLK